MITKNIDSIRFSKENIFDSINKRISAKSLGSTVIVPHVCNNIGGFGAGFASDIAKNYPEVKANFHMLGNNPKLGHVQYVKVAENKEYGHEIIFANMISQNGLINSNNPRPLNYIALAHCMSNINTYIKNYIQFDPTKKVEIHAPKFGSGLAGGNWNFIRLLIEDCWSKNNICIYQK